MKIKRHSKSKIKKYASVAGVLAIAIVGTWFLIQSFAASPTATASCGAQVSNYTYQVPWGNAVWNQPVCNLPRYSKSADYAQRFFKYAHYTDGTPSYDYLDGLVGVTPGYPGPPTLGDPDGLNGLFTREVYLASKSTTNVQVSSLSQPSNLDGVLWNDNEVFPRAGYQSQHPDTMIPWNPTWKTGKGGDNEIFILDDRPGPTMGRVYTIWIYQYGGCIADIFFPNRVCAASVQVNRDHSGNIIDYRNFEGYVSERGVGLSYYATLTTPEEVAAKEIRHALGVTISTTSFGPVCTKAQLGTNAEGTTCGTAVAPATKFEWGGVALSSLGRTAPFNTYGIEKTIPEGMRFAVDISNAQIENWLTSRNDLTGARKETARTFARALRDYGMIVVDTGSADPMIQMVGGVNPDNATQWKNLGVGPEYAADNLLKGLITSSNLYVVDPPTLTCADGTTSKNFCPWTAASYASSNPSDTVNPSVTITNPASTSNVTFAGTVKVEGTSSDNIGVTKVELLVDTTVATSVTTSSTYSFSLNSTTISNGTHTITVKAYDAAGNVGTKSFTVMVSNTSAPTVVCDFTDDGHVNVSDLSRLLTNYNKAVTAYTNGDCDGSGIVNVTDLSMLLSRYGT